MRRCIGVLVGLSMLALGFSGCCTDVEKKLNSCVDRLAKTQAGLNKANSSIKNGEQLLAAANQALKKYKERTAFLTKRLEALGANMGEMKEMSAKEKAALAKRLQETKELLQKLRAEKAKAEARMNKLQNLLRQFAKLIKSGKVKVRLRDGRMVVVLSSAVLFDSGRAKLKKAGQRAIAEITSVLVTVKDRKFQVAGHTDNTPMRSRRFKTNWELSTARAVSVVKYMQKLGMPAKQLSATGYGEFSPVMKNNTPENRAQNRRIEIVLLPNLDELPNLKSLFPS